MIKKSIIILRRLGIKNCLPFIYKRVFSVEHFYLLKRNLNEPINEIKFRITYSLEKIKEGDWNEISEVLKSADVATQKEFLRRFFFYTAGFNNCYVLKNKNGEIACILWIVYPSENEKLRKHYKSDIFLLKQNEVLFENLFTLPKFRGFGFSPVLTSELLKLAKNEGYLTAIAIIYSMKDRITSMNDMMNIGFKISKLIKEYRLFGLLWRVT